MAMNMEKGSVSIDAQNIMPVIKRWLYSDKDIFLREVVSNGCDAITKFRMTHIGTDEPMQVTVTVDKDKKELRIADTGIGMTADEVRRYINQVAFSSAEEFLKQYQGDKDGEKGGIIGHFGLGFYSVFMVADKVEIETLSCQEGAEPVHWESTDGMDFEMQKGTRTAHGTTIILHVSEEEKEFLEMYRVREVLNRYCGYMNSPIYLEDACAKPVEKEVPVEGQTNEDGTPKTEKVTELPKPTLINDVAPLWLKKPSECTDEEYKTFYHKMFSDYEDPLFWVHLNVDYPFNLKGILYFPKLKNDFGTREGEIKLFSGQVFVADNIKEIIPEFLMLLKGVIDCPDLPLNVSRSFLQNDGYVRKMSDYITRKVADRLMSEFNTKREDYQKYWKDIHPFVKYGCIRDEKFFSRVKEAIIYRTTAGEFLTAKEYKQRNCEGDETLMYYTSDEKRQAQMIEMFTSQGKDVVVMDTLIDNHFMSFLEYAAKEDQVKFRRVDAGLDGLTEEGETDVEAEKKLQELFREATGEKELDVKLATLKSDEMPAMITVEEQSRRFTEMSREWGGGMQMPEKRTLTLNRKHPLIAYLEREDGDADMRKTVCEQVVDLAEMARQPLTAERMVAFLKRSTKILGLAVKE